MAAGGRPYLRKPDPNGVQAVQHPNEQTILAERYRLDRLLGHGGMAEVYAATDLAFDRRVAVKVPLPQYLGARGFAHRFRRAAEAAANISHPHIVAVLDRGEQGGVPFLVMEQVDGTSLREALRFRSFDTEQAVELCADVASALQHAHSLGIVHRDIKPDNILLSADGTAKVVDFGLARLIDARQRVDTGPLGSAAYLSPEQASGDSLDARSDVYSLGIVLYELLTGARPFSAESPVAIALKHLNEPPPPPRRLNPAVPREVEAVVIRALAKDPRDRFQSMGELREALHRALHGQSVHARVRSALSADGPTDASSTEAQRVQESARVRRRQLALLVTLTLLAVVALLAIAEPVEALTHIGPFGRRW